MCHLFSANLINRGDSTRQHSISNKRKTRSRDVAAAWSMFSHRYCWSPHNVSPSGQSTDGSTKERSIYRRWSWRQERKESRRPRQYQCQWRDRTVNETWWHRAQLIQSARKCRQMNSLFAVFLRSYLGRVDKISNPVDVLYQCMSPLIISLSLSVSTLFFLRSLELPYSRNDERVCSQSLCFYRGKEKIS